MYSYEKRIKAVRIYIKYDKSFAAVKRELGYPKHRSTLYQWYLEFQNKSDLKSKSTRKAKYTSVQKQQAIDHYYDHGKCIARTVRMLGFPSRPLLKKWIHENHPEDFTDCYKGKPMVHLPQEQKEQAVLDVCMRAGTVQEIADQYGISRNSLYNWKKQLLSERNTTRMPRSKDNVPREEQIKELSDEVAALASEAEILRQQIYQLQLEKDVLQKATELLKKDQGVDLDTLSNREKAIVINALRNTYSLKELLVTLKIARSSYCYQENALMNADKYKGAREKIRKKFAEAYESYGYRRIYRCVKKDDGSNYSEKVIRRLMAEEGLVVKQSKHRKYNSYQGEITPPAENLIARDFHSYRPNQKWLTDITEFHIPAGRVYLSPIIDCFDGMPVAWTIGVSPNADLVNTMLDEAIRTLKSNEFPIVHSDRGCHYRWPGWIERMEKAGLTRSMSKKGCSPDNSACEGFFGRLKNEMFYNRSWSNVSINDFINELDTYLHWYAEKRIKISLGGLSPIQYRKRLGMVV